MVGLKLQIKGHSLAAERVERRLAAVLAVDVAGYSRLMGVDEEGTLARLKAARKDIVDPVIAAHRGRIVKTTGDGMLVEFASAVDAVICAMQVQDKMAEHNGNAPEKITFRIGINVGDIISDGDDIFGDGVNVAARVEAECEPGGVCLSSNAYEQVRSKTSFSFDDMGEKHLKNIDRPVRLYSARAAQAKIAAAIAGPQDVGKPPALPDQPSIAVLPFQNMSGDPEQEYFADGMVEDILTGLSHSKSLFVIARNSSFTFKGKAVDIKQVGQMLGVRYVLEGSVRKAGKRVRVTGQLIDATTDAHIWADKFDSDLDDIFDLQDRITSSVIGAILPHLERAEIERAQRKPTENLQAYDYYLRALYSIYQPTRESNAEALRLAKIAISLDPLFARAYALASNTFVQKKAFAWIVDAAQERVEGRQMAERAIQLGKDDPLVLAMAGHTYSYLLGDPVNGSGFVARAVALDPNLASARYWAGWSQIYLGNHDAAIQQFSAAIRLSPIDPRLFLSQSGMGYAHFMAGRYEESMSWAMSAMQRQPNFLGSQRMIFASLAMSGRILEARRVCDAVLQADPTLRISGIKDRTPLQRLEDIEKLAQAYRMAGVPE